MRVRVLPCQPFVEDRGNCGEIPRRPDLEGAHTRRLSSRHRKHAGSTIHGSRASVLKGQRGLTVNQMTHVVYGGSSPPRCTKRVRSSEVSIRLLIGAVLVRLQPAPPIHGGSPREPQGTTLWTCLAQPTPSL